MFENIIDSNYNKKYLRSKGALVTKQFQLKI